MLRWITNGEKTFAINVQQHLCKLSHENNYRSQSSLGTKCNYTLQPYMASSICWHQCTTNTRLQKGCIDGIFTWSVLEHKVNCKTRSQPYFSHATFYHLHPHHCACISTSSVIETLPGLLVLFSSNGPVTDIATAPSGAVTMIASTATVNSCHSQIPQTCMKIWHLIFKNIKIIANELLLTKVLHTLIITSTYIQCVKILDHDDSANNISTTEQHENNKFWCFFLGGKEGKEPYLITWAHNFSLSL